jgi:protein TonB
VSFGQNENKKKNENEPEKQFVIIDEVPMFRSCKNVFKSQRRECFQNKMTKHIYKHFYYPKYAFNRGIQGRVFVQFIIEKDGSISEIKTRGADKSLEKAALKIIKKLPKLIPGKANGKPVRVPYSIPITWQLG